MCKQDSYSVLKSLAILSTLLTFLTGLVLITMGLTKYEHYSSIAEAIGHKYVLFAIFVASLGVCLIIVSFFGFTALLFSGYKILLVYFYLMLSIFMLQVVFGGYTLINEHIDSCEIQDSLERSLLTYSTNANSRNVMEQIESRLRCCGLNGPTDYLNNNSFIMSGYNNTLPISCCLKNTICSLEDGNHWMKGCSRQISKFTLNSLYNIGMLLVSSSSISMLSAVIVYVHGLAVGQQFI